ncbi:hypothetical protein [Nocardia salmonicida]|uniref:hypothetical protein n=1 Tax=Nocardia salmonicida TaxID=53431 RepID=UPI0037A56874
MTSTMDTRTTHQADSPIASGLRLPRTGNLSFAAAVAPPPDRRAPVWDRPVPHSGRAPAIWLLGAHGGAGVSTLAQMLALAADCNRRWPAAMGGESPFTVIVARETIEGLARAHDLLRQYHCGLIAGSPVLVGLVTTAHQPGKPPRPIRRYIDVISDLVPEAGRWRIDWQDDWPVTAMHDLPTWAPGSEAPAKGADPLKSVRGLGQALLDTVKSATTQGETR